MVLKCAVFSNNWFQNSLDVLAVDALAFGKFKHSVDPGVHLLAHLFLYVSFLLLKALRHRQDWRLVHAVSFLDPKRGLSHWVLHLLEEELSLHRRLLPARRNVTLEAHRLILVKAIR